MTTFPLVFPFHSLLQPSVIYLLVTISQVKQQLFPDCECLGVEAKCKDFGVVRKAMDYLRDNDCDDDGKCSSNDKCRRAFYQVRL